MNKVLILLLMVSCVKHLEVVNTFNEEEVSWFKSEGDFNFRWMGSE